MNTSMNMNVAAHTRQALTAEIAKIQAAGGFEGLNSKAVANMLVKDLGEELIKTTLAGMTDAPQFKKDQVVAAIRDGMAQSMQSVSDVEQGDANINETAKTLVTEIVEKIIGTVAAEVQAETIDVPEVPSGSTADSWLLVLAQILGEVADKKLDNLFEAGRDLGGIGEGEDGFGTKSAELTASAKIFSIVMEATTNVLKTTGDGITTAARK